MQCCDCDTAAARRRAFTLVEVVVGTVLLAAFAGSTFLAFRVHNLQLRNAGDTLAAVNFADQKLESLLAVPRPFGKADGGSVPGHPTWRWSLRAVRRQSVCGADVEVSRFEVWRMRSGRRRLVAMEVVTHAAPPRVESSQP